MREALAGLAGALVAGGGLAACFGSPRQDLLRALTPRMVAGQLEATRRWLAGKLERAGWRQTPERLALVVAASAGIIGVAFGALALPLAPLGPAGAAAGSLVMLDVAIERRRRKLAAELVPLLELFTLELSGGGSALAALGSVTMQVESDLAEDFKRMLIASQVAGSPSFEARLLEYSERMRAPALASLATIISASREFGTGAGQGVRALATDLRRAQRRELIEHSRRALNHVLLPAAVCILLPFLSVLMFPAVSVLQRSLR